jgi:RNA polymerase sigma-70 factor (ECF subfamily)
MFRARLLRWARGRLNDPADAEDLVQDILVRASERLPSLRSRERLVPWLDALARNALVDSYRRRGRAPDTVSLVPASDPAEAPDRGVSALKSRVQRGRAMLRDAFTSCWAFERDAAGRVMDSTPRGPGCAAIDPLVQLGPDPVRNRREEEQPVIAISEHATRKALGT